MCGDDKGKGKGKGKGEGEGESKDKSKDKAMGGGKEELKKKHSDEMIELEKMTEEMDKVGLA